MTGAPFRVVATSPSRLGGGTLRGSWWPAVALALVIWGAGCGGDDDRPARWSYIQPAILAPSCATVSCHSAVTPPAGVRLDDLDHGYSSLTSNGSSDQKFFVVPGQPQRSKLLYLLRADGTSRMPRDTPLPEADIALIERWILEGATRD